MSAHRSVTHASRCRAWVTQVTNLLGLVPETQEHPVGLKDTTSVCRCSERRLRSLAYLQTHLPQLRRFRQLAEIEG